MMRILVAQMTRMGDVLQTTPLIRSLRWQYPDAHIAALVRAMGKPILERNPDVDNIIIYDEDGLYLDLRSGDSDRLLNAYQTADRFFQIIKDGQYDVIYNCTHSITSAVLFHVAGAKHVVGAHLSDDWQFVIRGAWTNYFFTSVHHREFISLNLCDVLRHFAKDAAPCRELVLEPTDDDRRIVAELLAQHGIGPEDTVVCLQLGASETAKRWPESHFASLAKLIREKQDCKICLVGVDKEAPLGAEFEKHAPGMAVHLFGRTSIPQLAALLERASILVTNDTGTMHIAAAVKCPIVLVSVGYVHFRETGPYGPGFCAIELRKEAVGQAYVLARSHAERSRITPDQVLCAMELTLATRTRNEDCGLRREDCGAPSESPSPSDSSFILHPSSFQPPLMNDSPDVSDVVLYVSQFAPDGCLDWYPIIARPIEKTDLLRIAYRAMWLDLMKAPDAADRERESMGRMLGRYLPPTSDPVQWRNELTAIFSQVEDFAQHGARTTERLIKALDKDRDFAKAKQLVADLMKLDDEVRVFGEINEACKPLVIISRFERENLEGADPLRLARTTLQIYRDLFARARLMGKKIDQMIPLLSR